MFRIFMTSLFVQLALAEVQLTAQASIWENKQHFLVVYMYFGFVFEAPQPSEQRERERETEIGGQGTCRKASELTAACQTRSTTVCERASEVSE